MQGILFGNIISGKTGVDILKPSSSPGEYVAAGITALIPGSGIVASLYWNVVSEIIVCVERTTKGEKIVFFASVVNIAMSTATDLFFEAGVDWVSNKITSKMPANYSSYAKQSRRANPKISEHTIRTNLRKTRRTLRFAHRAVNIASNTLRNTLLY